MLSNNMVYRINDLSLANVYKDIMTQLAKKMVCEAVGGSYLQDTNLSIDYEPTDRRIVMIYNDGSRSFNMAFHKHCRDKARLSVKGVIGRQEANKLVYKGFKTLYERILLNS